jgi:hypothetical protein
MRGGRGSVRSLGSALVEWGDEGPGSSAASTPGVEGKKAGKMVCWDDEVKSEGSLGCIAEVSEQYCWWGED